MVDLKPGALRTTERILTEALEAPLLARAASHPDGQGLEGGALFYPPVSLARALRRQFDFRGAGLVEVLAAGGWWAEDRRKAAGFRTTAVCRRCSAADESIRHILWECPHTFTVSDPAVTDTNHLAERALALQQWACYWNRGLVPSTMLPPIAPGVPVDLL